MINNFSFDYWTLVGITAQALFFGRFILQWYESEKSGKITIPIMFWIMSLMGASLTIVYALVRKDVVFLITGILQIGLFSRNLFIARKTNGK